MAEALAHAFLAAFCGVVVLFAIIGVCKLVEDWTADQETMAVDEATEPRE